MADFLGRGFNSRRLHQSVFLVVFVLGCGSFATATGGEVSGMIAGSVHAGLTVTLVSSKPSPAICRAVTTGTAGDYRFEGVPAGEYDLQIQVGFHFPEMIRGITVPAEGIVMLPAVPLEFAGICDTPDPHRARFYRLADGYIGTGSLSATLLNHARQPIKDATVKLYRSGSGRVAATTTDAAGNFTFRNLEPNPDYSIDISRDGYFVEEMMHLAVLPGLESVYDKFLEACPAGRCRPDLKAIEVLPPCCM
jgi:hypothetical protein